jgi:hypothetical protein
VNPPKPTILTAGTDAAWDPETGTCTIPQTPIPSPGAAPVTIAVHQPKVQAPADVGVSRLGSAPVNGHHESSPGVVLARDGR